MSTFNFAPLYRSTIGFDRLFDLLDHGSHPKWPPYNIEKVGEDQYRIVMAVAGFSKDDVEIVQEQNRLSVRGELKDVNGTTICIAASQPAPSSVILTSPTTSR